MCERQEARKREEKAKAKEEEAKKDKWKWMGGDGEWRDGKGGGRGNKRGKSGGRKATDDGGKRAPRGLYDILELKPSCKKADIKKAYHKLSLRWHPDKVKQKSLTQENESLVIGLPQAVAALAPRHAHPNPDP